MTIDRDFSGGNIRVLGIEGDTVRVENELRDTTGDWFYWAFRVKGAAGRTLTFDFGEKAWVGRWGAAVSHDGYDWAWGGKASPDFRRFSYAFGPDEDTAYFCHDIHYSPARFEREAREQGWRLRVLTVSEQGRAVPYVRLGGGKRTILLTSRHHACESTGTYVLEGFLREFERRPLPGYSLIAVPFMDMDGVANGDQGKNRRPHDHDMDYGVERSLYASVRAVRTLAAWEQVDYFFDLHAPWHISDAGRPIGPLNANDCTFIVRKTEENSGKLIEFSRIFEAETADNPVRISSSPRTKTFAELWMS